MNISKRQLVRIASNVRDQLFFHVVGRQHQIQRKLGSLIEVLAHLQAIRHKLGICQARGWSAAAAGITSSIDAVLRNLPHHMQELERAIQTCDTKVPSLREMYLDLLQADEEFGGLLFELRDQGQYILAGRNRDLWKRQMRKQLRRICRAAGLPEILPHGLRRTAATLMARAGVS